MSWTNEDLAAQFAEIAALLELTGEDRFRIRAYERAAEAITAATVDLSTLEPGELTDVKGIGDSTARKIRAYLAEGRIPLLDELREQVPAGVLELVRVPGLGPKTAMQIHRELGVDTLTDLEVAIDAQRLRDLPGLGAKTEENLRAALQRIGAKDTDRVPVADVIALADALVEELAGLDGVERVAFAGSLRRMRETIGDIDVLAAAVDAASVHAAFRSSDLVRDVLAAGERKTSVITARGLQADLRVVDPEAWGAALVYFTGSKAHNIRVRERAVRRDLTLNEYGLFRRDPDTGEAGARVASHDEADVYAALDLAWIPAPMREDTGEVDAAADGTLPAVVTDADVRGDLHGHSDWSGDGKVALADMLVAAARQGWEYWAVSDHAERLSMNGITVAQFRQRREEIARLRETAGIGILDAVELNIDGEGGLDYDDDVLAEFDWTVASIHTLFARNEAAQTERIIAACRHPAVNAIGHPTGRKIGLRPGYDIDLDAILAAAAETGTALEINGSPRRLDLAGELVRRAVSAGVRLTIVTDAHTLGDLDNMRYGVLTAQRGWATPVDVVNAWPLEDVRGFVTAKRERLA